MKSNTVIWRVTAAATAMSMTLGGFAPAIAAPPPIAVSNSISPPGRVGRLAHFSGTVSFHTADQTSWSPATLNYPITTGNALWTEPSADALVEVSGNRLAMDGATEFDIATLDDHALIGSTPQGELYLSLRSVPNGDTYTIQTPRGAVQIAAVGRYEIVAGDTDHPTTVTVVEGAAQITNTNIALQVGAGQMASINGTTDFQGAVGPLHQDAFLTKMLAQERPAARSAVAVPAVVASMTGCEDLDQYGAWSETPQNGSVWYPKVESGWVPYRHGRWSYVAPWGWTWVDDAPWGFAPFHYGRWIQNDDRWGWVPADPGVQAYPQPVYAPALVSWVDIGAAAAVGAAAGALLASRGDRSVGWVPLGPNEPYYPPYSHSLNYVRSMNVTNVRNVTQVINQENVQGGMNNRTVVQNFVNRGGATVVPVGAMAQSAPIAPAARPLSPEQFARARGQFQPPIQPTAATVGVTPAVARQFNFAPAARPGVAGPAINPAAFRPGGPRGAAPAFVPGLRPGGGAAPVATQPNPAAAPSAVAGPAHPTAPEAARPGVLPELRPATPPGAEPIRPPGVAAPGAPARPGEPGRPGVPEAARPGPPSPAAAQAPRPPEPARPPAAVDAVRPQPQTAPPRLAPVAPPRAAPIANPPRAPQVRPAPVAPRPAPPPRAVAPPPPRPAAPPPRPSPPPRPAQTARPAPPPRPAQAVPHPGPREEHH
jgi:hypothetical protein